MSKFTDRTGTVCPYCHSADSLTYKEIPEHRICYSREEDGNLVGCVEYGGPARDYSCGNCDAQFLINPPDSE